MLAQFGQSSTGELRLTVTDGAGLPLKATIELVNDTKQFRETLQSDAQGAAVARRLSFGIYSLTVTRDGFSAFRTVIDVRSAVPIDYRVTLELAPMAEQVTVRGNE